MSIFEDEYVKEQVKWFGLPEGGASVGSASCNYGSPNHRLDDYLNVNWRITPIEIPIYKMDGKTWMSMTPMEIQSAYVAIERAYHHSTIAIGGLGMGYVPLRIAAQDAGHYIDVYEKNADCIALFKELFSDREGFDQINFIEGDIYETFKDKTYDYCFMDIYLNLGDDNILPDLSHFLENNEVEEYRYWGQELMLYSCSPEFQKKIAPALRALQIHTFEDVTFFGQFYDSEGASLRPPFVDEEFAEKCVGTHCELTGG